MASAPSCTILSGLWQDGLLLQCAGLVSFLQLVVQGSWFGMDRSQSNGSLWNCWGQVVIVKGWCCDMYMYLVFFIVTNGTMMWSIMKALGQLNSLKYRWTDFPSCVVECQHGHCYWQFIQHPSDRMVSLYKCLFVLCGNDGYWDCHKLWPSIDRMSSAVSS